VNLLLIINFYPSNSSDSLENNYFYPSELLEKIR